MTLKSNIRQAELNITQRRGRIRIVLDSVAHSVSKRMVSPGALVAAGLIGAALERNHRLHGLRVQGLLETANAGLPLLLKLSSWAGTPAPDAARDMPRTVSASSEPRLLDAFERRLFSSWPRSSR